MELLIKITDLNLPKRFSNYLKTIFLTPILIFISLNAVFSQEITFSVDTDSIVGKNTEFWKAAGSDHLFYEVNQPSGQALLDRVERTNSHVYFRSHHSFIQDKNHGITRGQDVYAEDENGNPVYDFSNLNRVFGEYVKRGLKPIVEYDYIPDELNLKKTDAPAGNDEGMRMGNTGPNNWEKWSNLMKAATQNFIDTFGEKEVRTWYFEVWNEPDGWPHDEIETFYKMYDVFVDAVTSVDRQLRVGGPAAYHEHFLRPFLEHVVNGTNHVTGEKGSRLDFISYHIYGLSGVWLNKEPHIHPQVQRFSQSVLWVKRLISEFDELKDTPFLLDEWGMSSHYFKSTKKFPELNFRNTRESPLFLVKLVNTLFQIEDTYDFPTDLLLYWGFAGEADRDVFFNGNRELLTAGNIPKTIQTGYELLAKLKKNRLLVQTSDKTNNRFGLLGTKDDSKNLSMILYNYDETDDDLNKQDEVELKIEGMSPNQKYLFEFTKLDKINNNTYQAWVKTGKPESSLGIDLSLMSKAADLSITDTTELVSNENGELILPINLFRHSMTLIEISKL